jgi:uncharacterized protein YndB with AHSA1/START domain
MKRFSNTYYIHAPIENVFEAITNADIIEEWSGAPCIMDDKEGTEFSMWGGDIYGTNVEVIPNERIVQEWYAEDWESPSLVTLELTSESSGTIIEFFQENIPDRSFIRIFQGWNNFFFGKIREYFGHTLAFDMDSFELEEVE